jgi:large subunit ribosomal protein L4e
MINNIGRLCQIMMSMKVNVYGTNGEVKGNLTIDKAFSHALRKDIIKKAFRSEQSLKRQSYGADPLAGQKTSAHYVGRRSIYNSMMNREMARMKRITGGGFLRMRARFVPQAVKGRKAHPPTSEKNWYLKINKKEKLKALLSAVSATANASLVEARGHKIEKIKHIPLVLDDNFSSLRKAKEVMELLVKLGFEEELNRISEKKIRAGKGKLRGRKYVRKKGPLIIIKEDNGIVRSAANMQGFDISTVSDLSMDLLAPGAVPGRLCIWTKSALEEMEKIA